MSNGMDNNWEDRFRQFDQYITVLVSNILKTFIRNEKNESFNEGRQLEILIEKCGENFMYLNMGSMCGLWFAGGAKELHGIVKDGKTPIEAVSKLLKALSNNIQGDDK